jgi:chaperonin GroES
MKLRPRYDRVIVQKLPEEGKTESGLIIPDTAKGKAPLVQAKVVRVGEKVEGIQPGDIVGFQNGAGVDFVVDRAKYSNPEENEYTIIRDQDLMVVVDE